MVTIKKLQLIIIIVFISILAFRLRNVYGEGNLQAWCLSQEQNWNSANATCTVDGLAVVPASETLTISTGELVQITASGYITMDGTIDNNGTINSDGYIYNIGLLNNNNELHNFGTLYNHNDNVVNNDGTIKNNGTINNDELIENLGYFTNMGTVNNEGVIKNNNGTINTSGIINNYELINNDGTINNTGTIKNYCLATFAGTPPVNNPIVYLFCDNKTVYLPVALLSG